MHIIHVKHINIYYKNRIEFIIGNKKCSNSMETGRNDHGLFKMPILKSHYQTLWEILTYFSYILNKEYTHSFV